MLENSLLPQAQLKSRVSSGSGSTAWNPAMVTVSFIAVAIGSSAHGPVTAAGAEVVE